MTEKEGGPAAYRLLPKCPCVRSSHRRAKSRPVLLTGGDELGMHGHLPRVVEQLQFMILTASARLVWPQQSASLVTFAKQRGHRLFQPSFGVSGMASMLTVDLPLRGRGRFLQHHAELGRDQVREHFLALIKRMHMEVPDLSEGSRSSRA